MSVMDESGTTGRLKKAWLDSMIQTLKKNYIQNIKSYIRRMNVDEAK